MSQNGLSLRLRTTQVQKTPEQIIKKNDIVCFICPPIETKK